MIIIKNKKELLKYLNKETNTIVINDDVKFEISIDVKHNISAKNISAKNISYYAVCCAYYNINCKTIKGRRNNSKHFCLDGKITIKEVKKE